MVVSGWGWCGLKLRCSGNGLRGPVLLRNNKPTYSEFTWGEAPQYFQSRTVHRSPGCLQVKFCLLTITFIDSSQTFGHKDRGRRVCAPKPNPPNATPAPVACWTRRELIFCSTQRRQISEPDQVYGPHSREPKINLKQRIVGCRPGQSRSSQRRHNGRP